MKNKKWSIIFGHLLFWMVCVFLQMCNSKNNWAIDLLSVLIYSIPFYINYFIVLPVMPQKKYEQAILLSFSLYIVISFSQIYPLYNLLGELFVPMEIVGKGHIVGAILHLSFFFYAISSLSRILVNKMINDQKRYQNSIRKVDDNIVKIRSEMSFNFTSGVLSVLHEKALKNPSSTAVPIGNLSRVLRYKLHKPNSENTLLSDEMKVINQYVDLINFTQEKNWEILSREEAWIPIGSALKKVEKHIQTTNKKEGTLMISADEDNIWVNSK